MIAGVDEAGRGPLAGPVVAAAVILVKPIVGLVDSKKISKTKRERLDEEIRAKSIWSIAQASVGEIDNLNILWASMLAMRRAVLGLRITPLQVLVDGNKNPDVSMPCKAIVGGDATVEAISAASILAKVARDQLMLRLHIEYPNYCFDQHKGYATRLHREKLALHGAIAVHRKSFAPVSKILESA
ncbi:MAG: ribonuclease HII [Arenicellales bacterium WSBS_2016_MAG_OTU3]